MGLLSWLFGKSTPPSSSRIEAWHLDGITLPRAVATPMGGHVRCIGCVVDLDYVVRDGIIQVLSARLASSSLEGMDVNVMATRRGEGWIADNSLRQHLERDVLPRVIHDLVAKDQRLQRAMRGKTGMGAPATSRQKAFARRLGIRFDNEIDRRELSELIDSTLASKRK
jgi:hypothetical protein